MIALTPAEKQANYRKRKAAQDFAEKWKLGEAPTVEKFIEAKLQEEIPYATVGLDTMNAAFSKIFYECLEEYDHDWASEYLDAAELPGGKDYPAYSIANLLEAWKMATAEWERK